MKSKIIIGTVAESWKQVVLHERQWSYDNRLAENRRQAVLHECKWCMG